MTERSITEFSPHLFWDVDPAGLDIEKRAAYIIERVLSYGLLSDWKQIKEIYGLQKIEEVSLTIRSLDPVTLSFLSTIFKINPSAFRCYIEAQSNPTLWNS